MRGPIHDRTLTNKFVLIVVTLILSLQIEREVEEGSEGLSLSFKENKNPISPATGDEDTMENSEDQRKMAADTVMYSQRLQQKKEALLKRIAKLQKQCDE